MCLYINAFKSCSLLGKNSSQGQRSSSNITKMQSILTFSARHIPVMLHITEHYYLIDVTLAGMFLWHRRVPPVKLVRISHDVGEYWDFDIWISCRESSSFNDEYRAVEIFC